VVDDRPLCGGADHAAGDLAEALRLAQSSNVGLAGPIAEGRAQPDDDDRIAHHALRSRRTGPDRRERRADRGGQADSRPDHRAGGGSRSKRGF